MYIQLNYFLKIFCPTVQLSSLNENVYVATETNLRQHFTCAVAIVPLTKDYGVVKTAISKLFSRIKFKHLIVMTDAFETAMQELRFSGYVVKEISMDKDKGM